MPLGASMDRTVLFPGGGLSLSELSELAAEAEEAGFDAVYCVEAYRSGVVPLAAVAMSTVNIRIGSYVLNACFRPPVPTALEARDIDELSHGRLVLGVGSGNPHINADHLGVRLNRPLGFMRTYVRGLRAVLQADVGDIVEFEHDGASIRWIPSASPARPSIPIYLAAMYPKMRSLAAEVADGIALGSLHSAEYLAQVVRPAIHDELERHGRDPAAFRLVASALTSVREDADVARLTARRALCRLFTPLPHPYYESILQEHGFASTVKAIASAMVDDDENRAIACIDDDVVDTVLIAGDANGCTAALNKYESVLDEIVLCDAETVSSTLRPLKTGESAQSIRASFVLARGNSPR